jgi:carboxylesterase type B
LIYLSPKYDLSGDELALSHLMVDIWANFITSGNPNLPKPINPGWPKYSKDGEFYYVLNKVPRVLNDFTNEYTAAIQDSKSSGNNLNLNFILSLLLVFTIKFVH